MSEYENIYQGLLKRRNGLQVRVDKIKKDTGTLLNRDSEEQAVELENAEVLDAINEEALKEFIQINRTLEMIENNKYGKCIKCGMQIPVKRLEVVPHASLCVDCAASK